MHMSDALLSPAVGGALWGGAGALLSYSAARLRREGNEQIVPLMGVLGAFVFGAQMINFAIPGTGSSGHISGGILLAILLGPWASFIVLASVVIVQCLFFADGGLLALGANIINMGLFSCFVGYAMYWLIAMKKHSPLFLSLTIIAATIMSAEMGAGCVAIETFLSGRSDIPFDRFLGIMAAIHLPIGLIEGLVTLGVLKFVRRVRPDAIEKGLGVMTMEKLNIVSWKANLWIAILAMWALLIAGGLSWFASSRPDGLEYSLGKVKAVEASGEASGVKGKLAKVQEKLAVFPDYTFAQEKRETTGGRPTVSAGMSAVEEKRLSAPNAGTSLSGIVGSAGVAILVCMVGGIILVFRQRKQRGIDPFSGTK